MGILDYIFPKYCIGCRKFGEYICPDCFAQISFNVDLICLVCNRPAIDGITHPVCKGKYTIDGSSASITYKGITKRLVAAFKYKPYLSDLQQSLSDLFYEGLIQQEQFHAVLQSDSIIVPIPLHPDKLRERSYNQAEVLAKNLGKRFDIPIIPLLKRVKKTRTQTTLKREDRRENIKGAFTIDESILSLLLYNNGTIEQLNNEKVRNGTKGGLTLNRIKNTKRVILVDDVITSGATMLEAANVLKRNGVEKVWGIALAHGK